MQCCWLLIAVLWAPSVWTYSAGPPASVCESMTPAVSAHGKPQTSPVPYQLVMDKETVNSGDTVALTLSKIDPDTLDLKGFMIEAIDPKDNSIVGKFSSDSIIKVMSCGSSQAGAVSHNGPSGKKFAIVNWIAPDVASATSYKFLFTVVQHRDTFWVKNEAKTQIKVQPAGIVFPSPIASSQTEAPAPLAEPEGGRVASGSTGPLNANYLGCASTKGCFGSESDCVTKGDCQLMAAYQYDAGTKSFKFLLHGNGIEVNKYIALGLSTDDSMGSDLVFYCSNGGAGVKLAWNKGKNNVNGVTGVTVSDAQVNTQNGITTCKFTVPETLNAIPPSESAVQTFQLALNKYHLLLATGPLGNGALQYHTYKTPSSDPIDLKASSLAGGAGEDWLVQVHGALMIFAWLACAACGMLMARYYKQTWRSVKPMGKDLWFRCHQGFMGLAVLLTFTAFFVILAKYEGEPFDPEALKKNPHAVIGIICIICTFIQPIMAFFRPHPGTSTRPIFNWAHWFVGNTGFLFGIAAIFLAVELEAPKLPRTLTDAMIAYVVVHFLAHLVLMFQRYHAEHRSGEVKEDEDAFGSAIRKGIAFVYFLFVWVFSIAFVAIIFVSRDKK